ncbi:ribosome maturation factor RimP [Gemmatimonadota bacterium]
MAIPLPDLVEELEARLDGMGFELVEASWAGSGKRPILRIRADLPDSIPGQGGISVDQCAEISRALEPWLDDHSGVPERYVLEVSSPGVERPLTRRRDWERFRGLAVRIKGRDFPGERGNRLEGVLLGLEEGEAEESHVALSFENGEEVRIPLDRIQKAHLLFRWE